MRPTGRLHLGHFHGVLKNWVKLQHEYESYFFVADWHALTTHYEDSAIIADSVWEMVIDWLAAGISPGDATLFIQSRVPEHAELHLLLSMITPLGWLERVPSYKDQQEKLRERDLATFGFLGAPGLQSADILDYKAGLVPVGEDQVAHIELTREIARRFNFLFGREPGFEELRGRANLVDEGARFRLALDQRFDGRELPLVELAECGRGQPRVVPNVRMLLAHASAPLAASAPSFTRSAFSPTWINQPTFPVLSPVTSLIDR